MMVKACVGQEDVTLTNTEIIMLRLLGFSSLIWLWKEMCTHEEIKENILLISKNQGNLTPKHKLKLLL